MNAALKDNGILSTVDSRSEKIGYKIRQARLDKLPYMLVVGQKEEEDGTVSVRSRFAGDEGVKLWIPLSMISAGKSGRRKSVK